MREIKFRAFDPKRKQMIYEANDLINEYLIKIQLDGYISATYKQIVMDDEEMPILMQFTGLKDKNGKDIYEGDIAKVIGENGKIRITAVDFERIIASKYNGYFLGEEAIEIIGNIYENSELLTNKP